MEIVANNSQNILDPRKKNFAMQYLLDFNVPLASKRCGISKATANNWLREEPIKDFITENQAKVAQQCNITQEEVLNELGKIAFFKHDYMTDLSLESRPADQALEDAMENSEQGIIGVRIEDFQDIDFSAVQSVVLKLDGGKQPYLEIRPYNKLEALKVLNEWFVKSKPDGSGITLTPEDLNDGRSAAERARDYHDMVQNVQIPIDKPTP